MKREYLTTDQGAMLLEQFGIDAFMMFTIQELNDYITQYQIAGINNAAALLIQSECQNNKKLSRKLKIDAFEDQIIATEGEGTNIEEGIIYFDVIADVGKKKPKVLGTAVAIDYYNCIQTIVEADMLQEDQALTVDEVVKVPVAEQPEEQILEPELETMAEEQPEFIEEVIEEEQPEFIEEEIVEEQPEYVEELLVEEQPEFVEEVIVEETQGPTYEEIALKEAQEEIARRQAEFEMEKAEFARQQQALAQQQEIARQEKELYMKQQALAQQQEIARKQHEFYMQGHNNITTNEPIDYSEIYAEEVASDSPEADVKYYQNNNQFLNKVHYAKTHGYEGKKEYELYDKNRALPSEFKDIDYQEDFDGLSMPYGPTDIVIEDLELIGNSGYVPYPYGPLKRPPVPYDLWRLIKDKKNLK